MSRATLSVIGLYRANEDLFDDFSVPEAIDEDLLVDNILLECAELEVLYSEPSFMQRAIKTWSEAMLPTWERIYNAILLEYNPLENYDRIETVTENNVGNRAFKTQQSANTIAQTEAEANHAEQNLENTIQKVAGFNDDTLLPSGGTDGTSSNATTDSNRGKDMNSSTGEREDAESNTDVKQHEARIHGNIGVTTSQQMLQAELDIAPKLNIINIIVNDFKNRFCIIVY